MRLNNPTQLAAQLQRSLAPVYLIAGEEPLLLQEALDAVRAAARAQGYAEREVLDAERGFDWQRLLDTCNTPSLFAPRRIVEVRGSAAPDAEGATALTRLAQDPAPDVLLIVALGKLESRARNGAWYGALDAAGVSLYVWPLKPEELPAWIGTRLRAAGLQADPDTLRLLAERTEGNLLAAQQEVEKLALLYPGQAVGLEQIDAAVADSAHYEVFGWLNKVMAGDARGAVRGLDGLRGEGVDLLPILAVVANGLRQLARAAAAYARQRNTAAALEAAGVFRTNQPAFGRALERCRYGQVLGWLRDCAAIDALAKSSGTQSAAWEELLTLVLAASGAAKGRLAAVRQ
ncbi:MAG: DNA polymerase III subunit delta [Nevskia sp.]|nr:DNA polymerase III subunit delta [Nevskia sp.]